MQDARQIAEGTVGAQVLDFGVYYRVWAPDARRLDVHIERDGAKRGLALKRDDDGYWTATDADGVAGDLYEFHLDNAGALPDPASRFQPRGIYGPSECIDADAYKWACSTWQRPAWRGQTTYEVHIGTLTPGGTFGSAMPVLSDIRHLGVEAIELMPVADFAGNWNWGYDGVSLFAPARCYGRPDDLRALVDAAHSNGIAVILDVVYNHIGPQGELLAGYCSDYFRNDKETPWGRGFNLDGPRSGPVRDFIKANVAQWLDEFRIDGLRLDATHAILDTSPIHIIKQIAELAHARGAFVLAEDERNTTEILRNGDGGLGVDAAWADDFHHQVRVALTGVQASYFSAYQGKASDIAETIRDGWTYRGQPFRPWKGRPRGEPGEHMSPESFIYCIENHDQIGNRAFGERLENLVDLSQFRSVSMLLCLGPHPVLMFMGQEWAASSPFLFFSDHGGILGRGISIGRMRELIDSIPEGSPAPPDPESKESFLKSKIRWEERHSGVHLATLSLYEKCLHERKILQRSGAFARQSWSTHSQGALVAVRYRTSRLEKLLLVNLGTRSLLPESLPDSLGCGPDASWSAILNSEALEFGGMAAENAEGWTLHGPGALWLESKKKDANAAD